MKMHKSYKNNEDFITHKILDVLIEHTTLTLFHAMMVMSDESQNELVERIINHRDAVQSARIVDNTNN